jgi:hypothetical protein
MTRAPARRRFHDKIGVFNHPHAGFGMSNELDTGIAQRLGEVVETSSVASCWPD